MDISADLERCPACSARIRAGQSWCTLCHADLGQVIAGAATPVGGTGVVPSAPEPEPSGTPAAAAPATAAAGPAVGAAGAESADPSASGQAVRSPESEAMIEAVAARMLSELAAEPHLPGLPGPVQRLMGADARGTRVAAGAGGMALVLLLVFGLFAVIGHLV